MIQIKRFVFITILNILIFSACNTIGTDIPAPAIATTTVLPKTPLITSKPIKESTRYPIPNNSLNIEEDGDALTFENGSPIPAIAAYYKNQLLANNCMIDSESGSSMDAVVMVFKNCDTVAAIRIIVYANPSNSGSIVTIAPID